MTKRKTESLETAAPAATPGTTAAPAAKPARDAVTTSRVSEAVVKVGRALLESNPGMEVVYMTADGTGFYRENDAVEHARALTNKAVTEVKR